MPSRKESPWPASQAWQWTETRVSEATFADLMSRACHVSDEELRQSYRMHFPQHSSAASSNCKRNCKANPRCLVSLGESKWVKKSQSDDQLDKETREWLETEAVLNERRASMDAPVGLVNLGNTCYINSFLQILFHNTRLRRALYAYEKVPSQTEQNEGDDDLDVVESLQLVLALMEHGSRVAVDPSNFVKKLNLDPEIQQDAQEFSKLFLALLESRLASQRSPHVRNIVKNMFEGHFSYVTICDFCQHESSRDSTFSELDLAIQGRKTLEECLSDFVQEELLDGDNQYKCSQCDCKRDARRFVRLTSLPPVLNLQLNRFVFDLRTGCKKKVNSYIEFGDELDLSPFMNVVGENTSSHYVLTGVLMHVGGQASHGHYVAHVQDLETGSWYKFSDHIVEKVDKKNASKIGDEPDPASEDTSKSKNKKKSNSGGQNKKPSKVQKGHHISNSAYMLIYVEKTFLQSATTEAGKLRTEKDALSNKISFKDIEISQTGKYYVKDGIVFDRSLPCHLIDRVLSDTHEIDDANEILEVVKDEALQAQQNQNEGVMEALRRLPYDAEEHRGGEMNGGPPDEGFEFVPTKLLTNFFDQGQEIRGSYKATKTGAKKQSDVEDTVKNDLNWASNTSIVCVHNKTDVQALSETKMISKSFVDSNWPHYCRINEGHRLIGSNSLCRDCVQNNLQQLILKHFLDKDTKLVQKMLKDQPEMDENSFWVGKNSLKRWKALAKSNNNFETSNPNIPVNMNGKKSSILNNSNNIKNNHDDGDGRIKEKESPGQHSSLKRRASPIHEVMECSLTAVDGVKAKRVKTRTSSFEERQIKLKDSDEEKPFECDNQNNCCPENNQRISDSVCKEQCEDGFNRDLLCPHGFLSCNTNEMKLVSKDLWDTLAKYFPYAPTFQSNTPPCTFCQEASNQASQLQANELTVAMEQRSQLNDILNERNRPSWTHSGLNKVFIIPRKFVVQWKSFVRSPDTAQRVIEVCNQQLLCEHGKLAHTVTLDNETMLYMVSEDEWGVLKTLFNIDVEIYVTRQNNDKGSVLESNPEVCNECLAKRVEREEKMRLSYQNAKVYIRLLDESGVPNSDPDFNVTDANQVTSDQSVRRSGRRPKVRGEKSITVNSNMRLLDLKVKIMELFGVAPYDQTLVTNGRLLIEKESSLADLKIMPEALIFLRIECNASPEVSEETSAFPEIGFKGTGLLGS